MGGFFTSPIQAYVITTVAGTGSSGYSGDGGAATEAQLKSPKGVTFDSSGNLYIADYYNHRIRKVNTNGVITTVAGTGSSGYRGDGGAATEAQLNSPKGVAFDSSGNLYIVDRGNYLIRKVDTNGDISTVAGGGLGDDGGAATEAELKYPSGVAVDSSGNLYIVDTGNNRIRKVETNGVISTVAGTGTSGYSGDAGAATEAQLSSPSGVAVDSSGNLYIVDRGNNRIRKVDTKGVISTVAGGGSSGDCDATATDVWLGEPSGVAVDSSGNLYIAEESKARIRKVDTNGVISTVAGNGRSGYAINAQLNSPSGVALDSSGNLLYIADSYYIRKVELAPNNAPTLTHFSGTIDTTNKYTEVELTFAELAAQGDEADTDGTVVAFMVQEVNTGTLKIGTSSATATAYAYGKNETIDSNNKAYWRQSKDGNGTLNAFTVKAKDDSDALSCPAIQAQVRVNYAPTLFSFNHSNTIVLGTTNEDSEVEITVAELQGNADDRDGTVVGFVVQAVRNGILKIGTISGTATEYVSDTNETIDSSHNAYWTPPRNANGSLTAFTIKAKDDGDALSNSALKTTVRVNPVNDIPTLTHFSGPIDTINENLVVKITFAELVAQGDEADEADVDGRVVSFIVQAVTTGTLKIGYQDWDNTAYAPGTNDTIDDNHKAYWTPDAGATGTLDAFTVKAKDDNDALSSTAIQTQVTVMENKAPTLTQFTAPIDTIHKDGQIEISFDDLAAQGDETDESKVVSFVVQAVTSGTLIIGSDSWGATAYAPGTNDTIYVGMWEDGPKAYWTPDAGATGTLDAFTVKAKDDNGALSSTAVQAQVTVYTFSCAIVTEIPEAECEALVAFYNSTDGENWYNHNSGWNVTNTPCHWGQAGWSGVTCENGHVSSIDSSEHIDGMSGPIPPEIGNLTRLQALKLGSGITGSIPPEIGNLTKLTSLTLRYSQLTGSIPAEIGTLVNLTTIDLSGSSTSDCSDGTCKSKSLGQLTGSIPAEIGNLTNLTSLNLRNNQLTGSIPAEIGNLVSLESLYLNGNQLTSIPAEMGNLASLTWLNLSDNQLTSIPAGIGGLVSVKTIQLGGNQISSLPADMGNLATLKELNLAGNQLTSIPAEMGNFASLTSLNLSDNQLTSIPKEMGNLGSLTWLLLNQNQLTSIPAEMGNFASLTSLDLSQNQLTSIPAEMGNLGSLTSLLLNQNQLSSIPAELWNLASLTSIGLSKNQLSGSIPAEIWNLASLSSLDLSDNQLSGSIPPEIGNLTHLQDITLQSNQLTGTIPSELENLSGLYAIGIACNLLTMPTEQSLIDFIDAKPHWSYPLPQVDWKTSQDGTCTPSTPSTPSIPSTPSTPPSLTDFNATVVSQTEINLSWTDNSDDKTGFKVERVGSLVTTLAADATSFSDTGLSCGTTYTYSVKTLTADGESEAVTVSATTQACPATTPSTDDSSSKPLSSTMTVTVKFGGLGSGTIMSRPRGIDCQTEDQTCEATFSTGSRVRLTATANEDSEFTLWSGSTECNDSSGLFLIEDRACTAYFKLKPRTLSVDYPENGIVTSSPKGIDCGNSSQSCRFEFEGGKTIKLIPKANAGYLFDAWSKNCPNGQVELLKNTECAATFKPEPVVTTPVPSPVPDVDPTLPPTTGSVLVTIEPNAHDFGSITLNTSAPEKTVTLSNEGDSSVQIGQLLDNATMTEFKLTQDACSNSELGVSASDAVCQFAVAFEPKAVGTQTLKLSIPYTDESGQSSALDLALIGIGVEVPTPATIGEPPKIEAAITSHDFGEIEIGLSDKQTIRIFNSGEGDLNIGEVKIEGDDADQFSLFKSSCANNSVSPAQFCSVKAEFQPQTEGDKAAMLSIVSDDPDSPKLEISLTGQGFLPPTPNIELESNVLAFGEVQLGSASEYQNLIIKNTGDAPLELGLITLSGKDFEYFGDYCSNKTVSVSGHCDLTIRFKPQPAAEEKSATLSIPSNDPDTPTLEASLTGTAMAQCEGDYELSFQNWPRTPDFGTALVGQAAPFGRYQGVYSRTKGCDALKIDTISFTGDDSDEFEITDLDCYHNSWKEWSYSSCWFKTVFTPLAEGTKSAELTVTFNDTTVETIPIKAEAVTSGEPNLEVSPSSHHFDGVSSHQFTVTNTGNVNMLMDSIEVIGQDSRDFWADRWRCTHQALLPSEECQIDTEFFPRTTDIGKKLANLSIASNAPNTPTLLSLSGEAEEPKDLNLKDCSDENITIESSGSGPWATKAENDGWRHTGDSEVWTRLKNPNSETATSPDEADTADSSEEGETAAPKTGTPDEGDTATEETDTPDIAETAAPNRPLANDIVRINAGDTIMGIPAEIRVRTLCIEENATLTSWEPPESSHYFYFPDLWVYVTDYVENKGTIQGKPGTDEADNTTSCTLRHGYVWDISGQGNCAKEGASVYFDMGELGQFRNEGSIYSGDGGNAKQFAASGGRISIYGAAITNTDNIGTIRAGKGGSLTGTEFGQGGRGGNVSLWGNDYLVSDGEGIHGGDGGNCNPDATESQIGGNGGNARLNASNRVDLLDGVFATGKGGENCLPLGINGQFGRFNSDPAVLTVSGANTQIEGGDVKIFGGNGWIINLNNLSDSAITAKGDMTIAIGEGGVVNLTGNTGTILKSDGQLTVFADNIALDEGMKLADIAKASEIVVGPSKILREVSVSLPSQLSAEPQSIVPIAVTVSNGGPEQDSFRLSVMDTAGWSLSGLPSTLELAGLASTTLELNVTLAATLGATNTLTVIASSQNDPEAREVAQVQVSVIEGNGVATVDAGLVKMPGVSLNVEGGDVTLSTAGKIDFRSLEGDQVLSATGEVTLAVGEGGIIDLRGNTAAVLETDGEVVIYADMDNILLDPGMTLEELFKANNVVVKPSKASHSVALTSQLKKVSKPSGSVLPLRFKLANTGVEDDTYMLSVTDSMGWPLTTLPASKKIKALESVELLLNAGVMSSAGTTNVITITATSQTNPNVSAIAEVEINVTATKVNSIGRVVVDDAVIAAGPCTTPGGVINRLCRNSGRVLKDITIGPEGNISGGTLTGQIKNQGMVSQVLIEAESVLTGGKISGYVTNEGTLVKIEFVGAELTGGILSGKIKNTSQVGGVIKDVRLAKDAQIIGGIVAGEISGDPEGPATLSDLTIRSGTKLSHVILGKGVKLGEGVIFGEGVTSSGDVEVPVEKQTESEACELEGSQLPEQLLSAINGLPLFKNNAWALTQDKALGYLELTIDVIRYAIMPVSVTETTEEAGLVLRRDPHSLSFITESGCDVFTQPAVQAQGALESALSELGLAEFTVQDNGNLSIPVEAGIWYSVRPDWLAVEVKSDSDKGLLIDQSAIVNGYFMASQVFEDEGTRRKQHLYSAVAYPEVLYSSDDEIITEPFGLVRFTLEGKTYHGVVDYVVTQNDSTTDTLQVEPIPDANGDEIEDVVLIYPTGEQQIMFIVE